MTLSLQHVGKRVRASVHIEDVSLDFDPGSLTVLLGLTLSGKTSLMRLMAGLDKPTSGQILVDGRDTARIPVRKRNVAMVYQQFINYPSLSVYDNIASPLRLARVPTAEIDRRVRAEAERLQIDDLLDRLPAELSGGQQQRTAMARALVRDASLILLDEPLVNLDYKLREALRDALPRIFAGRQSIVVYATADPWEALALGGRTAVLHEGRLVQSGAAPDVYAGPATTHVASVFGDPPMNIFTAQIGASNVTIAEELMVDRPAHFAGVEPGAYLLGLRPQHLTLGPNGGHTGHVRAAVRVAEISGSETFIHFELQDKPWVAVASGVRGVDVGQDVDLYFDAASLFAFDLDGRLLRSPEAAPVGGWRTAETRHGAN